MISVGALQFVGTGLNRPECVLAHESGLLFAPCWAGSGGVSVIAPSGRTDHILAAAPHEPLKPNGIALESGGTFLLAHLGAERGAIVRLHADGRTETVTDEADGASMPPANFVTTDEQGRIWITVSTRTTPRSDDYRSSASTGFIAVHENGKTRIVADGLGYANEIAFSVTKGALSVTKSALCVNETFARRTTAFDLGSDGSLTNKRTVAEYGTGTFPDGLTPDADGGLWITSVVSNRIFHIDANGTVTKILEDSDPAHLDWVEAAFTADTLNRPHLDQAVSKRLKNISNLAFGGPDLRTAYLGSLLGDRIATFKTAVPGLPLTHWQADLGPLARYLETS